MYKTFLNLSFFYFFLSNCIFAQFLDFGKNKVRYDNFDWNIIRTEHFDIYYYPEITEIAEIGAKLAEDSYQILKIKFNHQINSKIPLIFYNTHLHFQQTNTYGGFIPEGVGGFFEFMKGRVVIPYLGSIDQFNHVIRHELVHVFTMAKLSRLKKDFRLISEPNVPLWFIEGLAELWSTNWDSQAEMVMKDAVLNNYFTGLTNIESIYGSFLMYKEGQKILQFLENRYGNDKILSIIENMWKSSDFYEVFESTISRTVEEFDNELISALKKEYYPLAKDDDFLFSNTKKITKDGLNTSPVIYIQDNKAYLYYLANRDGYSSIYKIGFEDDSNDPELVIRGEKSEELESFHLMRTNLAINKYGIMAFINKKGPRDVINIFDINQNEIKNTFDFEDIININSLNWANGKNKIVFSAIDKRGYSDIFTIDVDSSRLNRLTDDYYDDKQPIFSEQNDWIVFSSDRTEGEKFNHYNLFSLNLLSGKINYLTSSKGNSSNPKFSKDFSKLYFLNDFYETENIWTIPEIAFFSDSVIYKEEMKLKSNYLNSVIDYEFYDDTLLFLQCFDNYSFHLYKKILKEETVEENERKIEFEFPVNKSPWVAAKIKAMGEREKYSLQKEYSLDFAQSEIITNPVYGTSGGAVFSISDMFSDEQYIFYIYNTAQVSSDFLESFNVSISKLSLEKRTNYGFGVFHFSGRRYDIRESDEYFYERSYGGFVSLFYPFSTFRRVEISTGISNSNKEIYGYLITRKSLLLSNTISYVFDNSIWYYTGPIDGMRYSVLFGITNDIKYSNVNFYSFMFDFRYYLRIGLKSTIATRFQFFANSGKEARRFFMGGNWDLRGWNRWSIRGEKLWLSSVEVRFPLIDELSVKFPFVKLNFYGLRAALFYDMGSAWDDKYLETLGSVGFGFRLNLFGIIVLRYDMGKKIENDFKQFQSGLFYQFFFGWDF